MWKSVNVHLLESDTKSNLVFNTINKRLLLDVENIIKENAKYQHLYLTDDSEINEGDWYIDDVYEVRQSITSDKDYWNKRPKYEKIIATTNAIETNIMKTISNKDSFHYKFIPQISKEWIKYFVSKYNVNSTIICVEIEYELINIHNNLKGGHLGASSEEICYNTPLNKELVWFTGKKYLSGIVTDKHLSGNGGFKLNNFLKDDKLKGNRGIGLRHIYGFILKPTKENEILIRSYKKSWNKEELKNICKNAYLSGLGNGVHTGDKCLIPNPSLINKQFNTWFDNLYI